MSVNLFTDSDQSRVIRRTYPGAPRAAGIAIATLTLLAGCSSSDDGGQSDPPDQPVEQVSLKQFTGEQACEQLTESVRSIAKQMMREQLTRSRDTSGRGGFVVDGPQPVLDAPASTPAPESDAQAGAGERFSDTNVQVAGVDELDPVKNDGQYFYSLTTNGQQIILTHAALRPDNAMRVVGQARWSALKDGQAYAGEDPAGLFRLDDGQLLAVTRSGWLAQPIDIALPPAATDAVICVDAGCGPGGPGWQPARTHLRLFSTSESQAPAQVWQTSVAGHLLDARRIGNKVYVVSQDDARMPAAIRWWPQDLSAQPGTSQWNQAWDALITRNDQVIAGTDLGNWLPRNPDGSVATPTPAECQQYSTVDAPTRLGWMRVNTIDLSTRTIKHQTVLAQSSALYMSPNSLIVSTQLWHPWINAIPSSQTTTFLHRFTLTDQGVAVYAHSGKINGRLINRFAMDESGDGVIRVAAFDRDDQGPYSYLATLRERDGRLQILGRTGPIAPGETLHSARFVKDRAYLVTAIVIDPFFVFDLSDPSEPRQLGELKIPGFSSYLHPVGENHVLGIGLDNAQGWPRRVKASLFDVTNPTAPVEQSLLTLGDVYAHSPALWDPHAFTLYYPQADSPDAIMAIPIRSYHSSRYATGQESAIRLVDVRPGQGAGGLRLRGSLDMTDLLQQDTDRYGWRSADARRSIFIDNTVYGVSDAAIRSADINDPGSPLDTLFIP